MERIAVLGCGTMGHSIALNAAWAGLSVKMQGISDADLEQGWTNMLKKLEVMLNNGILSDSEAAQIQENIKMTVSVEEAVTDATFVIEAVPENIQLKIDLFKRLDALCAPDVILASNTSGLSPTEIASETVYPERTVVTHFWNPAHLIPLVEVVRGEKTGDEAVERSFQILKQMKKKPIEVKKEIPGFVGNRLQYALFREAQYLLEEGIASKEDIDDAVTYGIGRRLPVSGPLMTADMGGLDVFSAISDYLFQHLSSAEESLPILKKLVEEQKLGDKSGEGYYKWDEDFSKQYNQKREEELIRFLKKDLGIQLI
ncbi:3-hydroxyacyl-CoA dehydrogenase family protein [Cytobacillus oceanisediminis]|uniref:3-hydroxyacyl-CoA dehydrogenase family protein n=1 Tax=Cytobacillus TaxID=2675230 RepID=UPI00203C3C45|nr:MULTISPECIES: 3-hydroxyacyl-CoA dehydrogenase family protein [Cytobacillus]MBY0159344.1 3-hydroxyacyl-CoA dehydrogenase family protein [Cytobacillus firmus]MCM3391581.1 3-hydroxyacyl-CoA dehydrogenase family protein [Cytobacillus oceanisediminis]MCM3529006.1 3-hydroxyacyl-CoA dehydrogenase family protein [Cytobacillus oceanisediminis]UQX53711.1 3-hydroxyacyl-CoA dehydrogenase family protein [Cytobacillus pseudoceanisediminis]